MEYYAFSSEMPNPHLRVFCHYNSFLCKGNNAPFPLPFGSPSQSCSSCSLAAAESSPSFSMGKESCSSFRKLRMQLIRILAARLKLVI